MKSSPCRYALLTVTLGMTFMCGLVDCGSSLNGGGTGGSGGLGGTSETSCPNGATPPACIGNEVAGTSGVGRGGSSGSGDGGSGGTGDVAGSGGGGGGGRGGSGGG